MVALAEALGQCWNGLGVLWLPYLRSHLENTALSIINTTSSIFDPIIELERGVFKMNGRF